LSVSELAVGNGGGELPLLGPYNLCYIIYCDVAAIV
jgi:hypothetical protein